MNNSRSSILPSLLMLMIPVINTEASAPVKRSSTTPTKKVSGKNSAKSVEIKDVQVVVPDELKKKVPATDEAPGKLPAPKFITTTPKTKGGVVQSPSSSSKKKPQSKKLSHALGAHLLSKLEEMLDREEFSNTSNPEDVVNEEDPSDQVKDDSAEDLSLKQRQLLLIKQIIDENVQSEGSTDEEDSAVKKLPAPVARTPNSDQRKLIVRHRASLEKSGSIPDNISEQLDASIERIPHAVFAPVILPCLLKLISEEQEGIRGACYELDELTFAQAWVNQCNNNGINGELVLNYRTLLDKIKDKKSSMRPALELLQQKILLFQNTQRYKEKNVRVPGGGWINYDTTNGAYGKDYFDEQKKQPNRSKDVKFFENMHHKFFLFNRNEMHGPLLVTGSFNWTSTATDSGWENVVILNDPHIIAQFIEEWQTLEKYREAIVVNAQGQVTMVPKLVGVASK